MLMPAAVLVVIILGAIAVDQAVVFTRQRELIAAAEAAANDAAGYGIDRDAFYRLNQVVFRLDRATEAAQAALEARGTAAAPTVRLSPDGTRVEVSLRAEVPYLFAKAVPGAPDSTEVRARASAALVQEP